MMEKTFLFGKAGNSAKSTVFLCARRIPGFNCTFGLGQAEEVRAPWLRRAGCTSANASPTSLFMIRS